MGASAIGSPAILSSLLNLNLTGSLSAENAEDDDYRALVCVFLVGGNDSYNMVAPIGGDARTSYDITRSFAGVPVDGLLPLPEPVGDGLELGIHASMPEVHSLYTQGKAAIVANVGTLIGPTDLTSFQNGMAKLPLGLFSHSDQQQQWLSTSPETRSALTGWGGRMADLVNSLNGASKVSMNVSVHGLNIFQSGNVTTSFAIGSSGAAQLLNWDNPLFAERKVAADSLLSAEYDNIFERAFATTKKDALEANTEYIQAVNSQDPLQSTFTGTNELSKELKVVAETINSRVALNKTRQTFYVSLSGFDSHASTGGHAELMRKVSQALGEFQTALAEMGLEEKVTTFTCSDFARTAAPNSSGTDHGWGGNQFVIGGAVSGRKMFGTYPELALGTNLDTGRGRYIPTTAIEEYYADLALWMGVSRSDLPQVLPNIGRFWSTWSQGLPLGIMA
ncbi:DUF1501 domain-containing protein [Akkermansiaceae bacterium]|nr:DUF1501 domain-containing protein [Akkermansiaceae bacterium]MDB4282200.1 DUF1501 domain-containing protein [Akkermansiaceae bacterium]MDC0286832.1 DUF1501 domain-containing protein [Akkermansiaceae bacterium]MDC1448152.1 DUF1501 domain-containing protein [bacterium]